MFCLFQPGWKFLRKEEAAVAEKCYICKYFRKFQIWISEG